MSYVLSFKATSGSHQPAAAPDTKTLSVVRLKLNLPPGQEWQQSGPELDSIRPPGFPGSPLPLIASLSVSLGRGSVLLALRRFCSLWVKRCRLMSTRLSSVWSQDVWTDALWFWICWRFLLPSMASLFRMLCSCGISFHSEMSGDEWAAIADRCAAFLLLSLWIDHGVIASRSFGHFFLLKTCFFSPSNQWKRWAWFMVDLDSRRVGSRPVCLFVFKLHELNCGDTLTGFLL